jgi:predicted acyltransferase
MAGERLLSVDAFRGLTVASMVLVNNPASWTYVYAPLRHAAWHGWTPTDLIFPFFLFIVGISISLSLGRRLAEGKAGRGLYGKILKRSFLILIVGWFLHLFPRFRFATMRIPGVLPRIAVCFLLGALIYLKLKGKGRGRGRAALSAALLLGYWAALTFIPVPGHGAGILEEKGNLCGYVDHLLLSGHLYKPDFDPEGLLSTIPAVVTVLLGTLAGDWLRSSRTISRKALGLFLSGVPLTAAGLALAPLFPLNKQLWTSTYVLFTGGLALLVFVLCFILIERLNRKRWAWPFLVIGSNAITVFAGSTLMVKILMLIKIPAGEKTVSPITWLYNHVLSPLAGPYLGSLIYPLLLIVLWVALMAPLYKHKIFIKL